MVPFARWTAYTISVLIGAFFYAAQQAAWLFPERRALVFCAVAAIIAILALLAGIASGARVMTKDALRFATAPSLFAVSAFGFFLLVESDAARLGVAASAAGLMLVYFTQLEKAMMNRGTAAADLLHLLHAFHAVTLFYGYAFAFGISSYVDVSTLTITVIAGIVSAAVAWYSLPMPVSGEVKVRRLLAVAFGVVGAELYVALSYLPTAPVVNATAAVILLTSALHVCRQVAAGMANVRMHRHELATASLLVAIVLLTARWA